MTAAPHTEQLTPLDLLMPGTYNQHPPSRPDSSADSTSFRRACPGYPAASAQRPRAAASTLELRWDTNAAAPALLDKGAIEASYDALSAEGMAPSAVPADVWPVPAMIDPTQYAAGVSVFTASLFRFAGGEGVGVCVAMHHNAVDASGFAAVIGLWARSLAESGSSSFPAVPAQGRLGRLSDALAPELAAVSTSSLESLLESHPEYSRTPPALPTEFPSCTSKVFTVPMARLDSFKELLGGCMTAAPTTNALLCALVWSAITRVRMLRNPGLAGETSRLVTAVNGRKRISEGLSTAENPYLGNAVLYSLAKLDARDLASSGSSSGPESAQPLADLCHAIAQSQSPARINARHIAEACRIVGLVEDHRTIFPGWDLFGSCDLTITSWANLDFYDLEFGAGLGKAEFVRVPYTEADGVALVLPRRRAGSEGGVLDVMVMLRRDDMDALEKDGVWKTLVC